MECADNEKAAVGGQVTPHDDQICDDVTAASNEPKVDEVLDHSSSTSDPTGDSLPRSQDVTTTSIDLFANSRDSFDELVQNITLDKTSDAPESSPNPNANVTSNVITDLPSLVDDVTGRSHDLTRHLVLEVVVEEWREGERGRSRPELRLRLLEQSTMTESVVHLRDEW